MDLIIIPAQNPHYDCWNRLLRPHLESLGHACDDDAMKQLWHLACNPDPSMTCLLALDGDETLHAMIGIAAYTDPLTGQPHGQAEVLWLVVAAQAPDEAGDALMFALKSKSKRNGWRRLIWRVLERDYATRQLADRHGSILREVPYEVSYTPPLGNNRSETDTNFD